MNTRKYNTNPEVLLEQGKAIMSSTDEARFHFKVFAVNMVLSGCPVSQISAMAGVSKVAVTGWVKTADEQGFDALRSRHRSGRPPKLSAEQRAAIDSAIQSDPKTFGFKEWDGPSLSSYINNTFGVRISVRQCQRLFHDLGYSHIRPQPYPSKGYEDSKEREAFKKTGRNRKRQFLNPCISGRGSFPDSNIRDFRVVQKGKCPDSKVVSRPFQGFLQRLYYPGDRRAVCSQTGKIQL